MRLAPTNFSESPRPTVSAVVVSYNTRDMTLECLRTLCEASPEVDLDIWVVDNASADGSAAAVRDAFPQAHVINNPSNRGFGAANNQALAKVEGEFVLLLNSDAFPRPHAVGNLVDYLHRHPRIGVAAPRLINADGSLQRSCYRFPTPGLAWRENLWISAFFGDHASLGDYRRWAHDHDREVEWAIGACLLLRREVYERVGGFDEAFFMYAEEADWQRRIRDSGFEIAFTPSAVVKHLGGASGAAEKVRVNRHFFDSLDHYVYKHHGWTGLLQLRLAMIIGCAIRGVAWCGVFAARPGRRAAARAKAKLHAWLVVRQLTHWQFPAVAAVRPSALNTERP